MTSLPLTEVRVLELGSFIAVPYATSLLASLGAEVIKLEPAPTGDPFRRGLDDADPYFAQYNAGKKSISVDLKAPAGRELVVQLLETCDALIHNLRPGKAEKLGLGAEQLATRLPGLVYMAVSGFGAEGPLVARPGYDSAAQSMAGLYSLLAPESEVQAPGLPLADISTGVVAAIGVCAQLAGRTRTQSGGSASTSLFEVATMLSTSSMMHGDSSDTVDSARAQLYCITGHDGRTVLVALGVSEETWTSLLGALDAGSISTRTFAGLPYDQRVSDYARIKTDLQLRLGKFTASELVALLDAHAVPATVARSYLDAIDGSPEFASRVFQEGPADLVRLMRPGVSFDHRLPHRLPVVPRVGAHTQELLREVASATSLEKLATDGVVFWPNHEDSR